MPERWADVMAEKIEALRAENEELNAALEQRFVQGYVCACATLQRSHGLDSVVDDLMGCIGRVDWSCIDAFDCEALRQREGGGE